MRIFGLLALWVAAVITWIWIIADDPVHADAGCPRGYYLREVHVYGQRFDEENTITQSDWSKNDKGYVVATLCVRGMNDREYDYYFKNNPR